MAKLEFGVERGLRWSTLRQTIVAIASVVSLVVLARLLTPADFGAAALAMVVLGGLRSLTDLGVQAAVIHYREDEDDYASVALWMNLALSLVAAVIVLALAGALGRFYDSPLAAGLTRVAVVSFIIESFAVAPLALIVKGLQFTLHETIQGVKSLIIMLGPLVMAVMGFGAWSLVVPYVIGAAVLCVLAWLVADFRPVWRLDRAVLRNVVRFAWNMYGGNVLDYLIHNLDDAIIGRALGTAQLGLYNFAKKRSLFVALNVSGLTSRVALPTLARDQGNPEELEKTYLDMLRLSAALTTPAQVGLIVVAEQVVPLVFGQQWVPATAVFRLFFIYSLVRSLSLISTAVTAAIGRPDVPFRLNLVQLPLLVFAIWLGLKGGLIGVTVGVVAVTTGAHLVYVYLSTRLLDVSWRAMWQYLGSIVTASGVMGLIALLAKLMLTRRWSVGWPSLIGAALIGGVVYIAVWLLLDRHAFVDTGVTFLQVLVPRKIRRSGAARGGPAGGPTVTP